MRNSAAKHEQSMIGDIEVPEPMREATEVGAVYYLSNIVNSEYFEEYRWESDDIDLLWFKRGLCQATKEGAIAQSKATIKLYTGEQQ